MGIVKVKLTAPLKVNGQDLRELDLDFDAVTADDYCRASERKGKGTGLSLAIPLTDSAMHLAVAFFAASHGTPGVAYEDCERLKGADVVRMAAAGQAFFIASASTDWRRGR